MTTEIPPKIDRPPFNPVNVSSQDFWAQSFDEREKAFKILRDESPVSWHRPMEGSMMEPEIDGVWVVTRHEDVGYVSKNPETFCSGQGITFEAVPEEMLEAAQSFLGMDGAKHSSLRRLVSSVFTPTPGCQDQGPDPEPGELHRR